MATQIPLTPPPEQERKLDSETSSHSSSDNSTGEFNPGWRFILAFLSLTTITLMVALDATSISVALPVMARLLHG